MIEEDGRVVRVDDGFAWVETQRPGACGGCAAGKGCGISALGGVLGRRKAPVRVINRIGAVAGDQVVIAISEAGLLRGRSFCRRVERPVSRQRLAQGNGRTVVSCGWGRRIRGGTGLVAPFGPCRQPGRSLPAGSPAPQVTRPVGRNRCSVK
jgi:hypothetical protein